MPISMHSLQVLCGGRLDHMSTARESVGFYSSPGGIRTRSAVRTDLNWPMELLSATDRVGGLAAAPRAGEAAALAAVHMNRSPAALEPMPPASRRAGLRLVRWFGAEVAAGPLLVGSSGGRG